MRAHIAGIKALLSDYGHPVYFGDVPAAPSYPYVLLWSGLGRMRSDEFCGARDDLNDLIGVTTVAETPDAALVAGARVRSYLLGASPIVAGRFVQPLSLHDSQQVVVDRDVKLPATDRHPAYVVDLFRIISEPIEQETP